MADTDEQDIYDSIDLDDTGADAVEPDDSDDDDDLEAFAEYERRHAEMNQVVEQATSSEPEPEPVQDFGEMPKEDWDRLQLERSDATEEEKVALFRQQAEDAKAAEAKAKQDAELQGFIDLMREANERQREQLAGILPQEPEPEEVPEGDLSNKTDEEIKAIARQRMLQDKTGIELKMMGINEIDVQDAWIDTPDSPSVVEPWPDTEYSPDRMDDATFRAFMAKRDEIRNGR